MNVFLGCYAVVFRCMVLAAASSLVCMGRTAAKSLRWSYRLVKQTHTNCPIDKRLPEYVNFRLTN